MADSVGKGVMVQALTFNGSIPGPIIVAHQDDYIELSLTNASTNQLRHTIDLHAATGALGAAGLMKVDPGETKTVRFKATKTGVFVYHCAPGGAQIPFHVVSGMNGAIMVLPRGGLKDNKGNAIHYDKAYYIGEQDFYIPKNEEGAYKSFNSPLVAMPETLNVMKGLVPTHLVFNGEAGSLTGKNALTAAVGEKVLFIHSQANRDSRPHLIGGHADLVWQGGSFSSPPVSDYETWFVPGGTAVAALYEFKQPGTYVYVNHNLIEGVLYGAIAHVQVTGEWNDDLMVQIEK
jgi:nitrite reductase (NO-forming)